MGKKEFIIALQTAREQLAEKLRQRDTLNMQILQLEKTVRDLSMLVAQNQLAEQPESTLSMRDAIITILRSTNEPMNTVEIRNALLAAGFNVSAFTNHMAAIHNALRRMHQAGDVAYVHNIDKWVLA